MFSLCCVTIHSLSLQQSLSLHKGLPTLDFILFSDCLCDVDSSFCVSVSLHYEFFELVSWLLRLRACLLMEIKRYKNHIRIKTNVNAMSLTTFGFCLIVLRRTLYLLPSIFQTHSPLPSCLWRSSNLLFSLLLCCLLLYGFTSNGFMVQASSPSKKKRKKSLPCRLGGG